MYILKMVSIMLLTLSLLISNGLKTLFPADIPEAKSEREILELTDIFADKELNDEITVVKSSNLTYAQRQSVICLQGLVAKTEPSVFISTGDSGVAKALDNLEKQGYTLVYNDENGNAWNFESVVKRFSSYIADGGYVLYSDTSDVWAYNLATNYATLNGWLAVPAELEESVKNLGLTKCLDLTEGKVTVLDQLEFYETYKSEFRNDCLVHQNGGVSGLRDLAVAENILVFYTDEDDVFGKCLRTYILNEFEYGSPVLGWGQYEVKYVESVTALGNYVLPADHSYNTSILSSCVYDTGSMNDEAGSVDLDPDKHYVVLLYSDGDNVQWVQNGYSAYYEWQSYDIDTPVSWSFPPLMNEISSADTQSVLDSADAEDCFVTGPSGAGYTRMSKMYGDGLDTFSSITAGAMLRSGMTTVTILDEAPTNAVSRSAFENKLGYYARYENIAGGLLELDPDRYSSGNGSIYFVNDKPFISVRLSLWYPTGNAEDVTNEWLKEQADIVNSYEADINSVNGYTVVNIHPWTMDPVDVAYFVSQLDEDVEVITADEMISALTQYVPHEYAVPNA